MPKSYGNKFDEWNKNNYNIYIYIRFTNILEIFYHCIKYTVIHLNAINIYIL